MHFLNPFPEFCSITWTIIYQFWIKINTLIPDGDVQKQLSANSALFIVLIKAENSSHLFAKQNFCSHLLHLTKLKVVLHQEMRSDLNSHSNYCDLWFQPDDTYLVSKKRETQEDIMLFWVDCCRGRGAERDEERRGKESEGVIFRTVKKALKEIPGAILQAPV